MGPLTVEHRNKYSGPKRQRVAERTAGAIATAGATIKYTETTPPTGKVLNEVQAGTGKPSPQAPEAEDKPKGQLGTFDSETGGSAFPSVGSNRASGGATAKGEKSVGTAPVTTTSAAPTVTMPEAVPLAPAPGTGISSGHGATGGVSPNYGSSGGAPAPGPSG